MGLVDRYILRAVATPLLLSLCVAGMLLLLEQMLRLFDFVVAERGPAAAVWRMLASLVPQYLSLALPLGVLLGIMLAFRGLSLSGELDAMNAGGLSFRRLLRPVYGLVAVLALLDLGLVGFVMPYAGYAYREVRFDVTSGAFGLKLPPGEFVDLNETTALRIGSVDEEAGEVRDIFLETRREDGGRSVVTAARGRVVATAGMERVLLTLEDARQLFLRAPGDPIEVLDAPRLSLEVDLPAIGAFRARGGRADEATLPELWRRLQAPDAPGPPTWDEARAAWHWRLLQPLSFLALPVLAVGAGVAGRRRASSLPPLTAIGLLIAYHELAEEWAEGAVAAGAASPWVAMWGLFAAFVAVSFVLYGGAVDRARLSRMRARIDAPPPPRVGLSPAGAR